jgi:hypothetical protein
MCEVGGSHSGVGEDYSLLGYDAVWVCKYLPNIFPKRRRLYQPTRRTIPENLILLAGHLLDIY